MTWLPSVLFNFYLQKSKGLHSWDVNIRYLWVMSLFPQLYVHNIYSISTPSVTIPLWSMILLKVRKYVSGSRQHSTRISTLTVRSKSSKINGTCIWKRSQNEGQLNTREQFCTGERCSECDCDTVTESWEVDDSQEEKRHSCCTVR